MHGNGQPPRKSKRKNPRLAAIEESYHVLFKIACRDRSEDAELDEDELTHKIIDNMDTNGLPLDQDTAEYFVPDEDEFAYLMEALVTSPFDFITTLAGMKAQNFMHGYIHAQIEDGKRSKDGTLL